MIFLIVMTSVINVTVNFLYASENLDVPQAADNDRTLSNTTVLGYTGFDMVRCLLLFKAFLNRFWAWITFSFYPAELSGVQRPHMQGPCPHRLEPPRGDNIDHSTPPHSHASCTLLFPPSPIPPPCRRPWHDAAWRCVADRSRCGKILTRSSPRITQPTRCKRSV